MALTTFLMTVSIVTIASAGWPGWPANDMPFPRFPPPMLRFGPPTPPSLLGMPTFPPTFPFFQLPVFPTFPPIPSVADIVKGGTSPNGGSFSGVVVSTKSESKRKEDGTIVHEGGSIIVTNDNGEIQVTKTGNAPPELELSTERKPFQNERVFNEPKIKHSSRNNHRNFNFKNVQDFNSKIFEDIKFGSLHLIPQIKTHVPGPNETYVGSSLKIVRSSSNNNGQVKHEGSIDIVENVNGRVSHQHIPYHRGGSQP